MADILKTEKVINFYFNMKVSTFFTCKNTYFKMYQTHPFTDILKDLISFETIEIIEFKSSDKMSY